MRLDDIGKLESEWLEREPDLRMQGKVYGWEPYPPVMFANLLYLAISRAGLEARFLDIGGGIGTKALIAKRAGLDAWSIDCHQPYIDQARDLGVSTIRADIRNFAGYGEYDILYINHPLRDTDAEDELEREIHRQMKPGAVIITVQNIRTLPTDWEIISRPLSSTDPAHHLRFDWVAVKL